MNSTPRPRNAGALGQGCIGLCFGTVWSQVRYGFRIRYSSTCRAPGARRRDADGAAGTRVPTALPFAFAGRDRIFYSTYSHLRCVLIAFDRFRLSDSVHRPKAEARATSSWRPDRAQRRDIRPHAEHADRPYTKDCFYSHHRSKANLPAACTTPLRPVSRNASTSNHLAAATASHENALLGSVVDDWDAPHGRGWDAVVACDGRPQGIAEDDTGEPVHLGVFDIKARKPA